MIDDRSTPLDLPEGAMRVPERSLPEGVRPNYDIDGRPRTDQRGVDLLLEALIRVHRHPRYDFFHHVGKQ
jgi:hypothetical protein